MKISVIIDREDLNHLTMLNDNVGGIASDMLRETDYRDDRFEITIELKEALEDQQR